MTRVYLDNNSTTPIDPRVARAMEPYVQEVFGNPSNIHSFGRECSEGVAVAREQVAAFIGAGPDEVFFTGSGTEADNWAIKGVAFARAGIEDGSPLPQTRSDRVEDGSPLPQTRLDRVEDGSPLPQTRSDRVEDGSPLLQTRSDRVEDGSPLPQTRSGEGGLVVEWSGGPVKERSMKTRLPQTGGKHVVCSSIEHSAVLASCRYLESLGFRATYLPVDGHGLVDPGMVKRALTGDTVLVSVMLANNEIGTIEPVAEIARICREAGVLSHTDAVAAAGKMKVDVRELGVDLLTLSGHKLRGPKGVGALYIRQGTEIHPFLHGGHQERGLRGGTENVIGIAGLGKACELLAAEWQQSAEYERRLRDRLEQALIARIPEVRVNGHPTQRVPNVCHLSVGYVEGEALLVNLDLEGVAVASGSACSTGSDELSPTLVAIGVPPLFANSPVRMSLGPQNTEAEIDYTIEVFERVVARLRAISPIWKRRA